MHRFRKRSDAKRPAQLQPASAPVYQIHTERYESAPESLPELPPASDFRTSLILTDLSRRFTLLGDSPRESVPVDALRSRLADQRARGAENQITEEEEDMIIETLGLRPTPRSEEDESSVSARSAMSGGASSSGASSKRYSNNLFGSGRFRDYSYMRSVAAAQSKTASMRTSGSSRAYTSSYDSMRPVTPDANASSSTSSSPETLAVRSAPLIPPAPYGGQPLSVAEYRLSKTLGPSVLRRASLALEEAIKAIEEEAEDEIVMPRSAPIPRGSLEVQRQSPEVGESDFFQSSGIYEAGMAISSDKHVSLEPESPRASPIPSRTIPGYIPGMPRPMTPRDTIELDDQRSYSTTPRATSPSLPSLVAPSPIPPSNLSLGFVKRESTSSPSRQPMRPTSPPALSPMFLQRTPNGRYTPDDTQRAESTFSGDFEGSLNSSILGWRRPASPLSGTAYQPMTVSARPGTPSNVTWTTTSNGNSKQTSHTRDPSWISDSSGNSEQSAARSLRSPALPDSPLIGAGHANMNSFSSGFSSTSSFESPRPMSSISGVDIGSPAMTTNRAPRSPTPTQVSRRSPTSATFPNFDVSSKNGSRRSSKQNAPSSPFSLGPFQSLVFSPIANSSRSSLESAGSSYHSWDGDQKDRTVALFSDVDPQRPLWHDISLDGQSTSDTPSGSPPDDWEAEDVISKYAGLRKADFFAIQEKLVGATVAKTIAPDVHNRSPSLRRRRPSTSQSNYSLNGRVGSPPQSAASPTHVADQYSALLNSVVDSLQSEPRTHQLPPVDTTIPTQSDKDVSPTTRRNRDLAQVLFGQQEKDDRRALPSNLTVSVSGNPAPSHVPNSAPLNSSFPMHSPQEVPASSASSTWPYQPSRNPSTPRLPQSAQEHADLAREVQRKTDAAMLALQKQPSNSNIAGSLAPKVSVSRKRISPNQISTPQLVSASTSVDTIPLPSPAIPTGQSKIGSRLKRLRGSLRAKPTIPTAEDITPFPMDLRSPPLVQTARYDPAKFRVPGGPSAASATELEGFKVPLPSPPASAGPGLKGFMARFRGKQRISETQTEFDHRGPQHRGPYLSPSGSESTSAQQGNSPSHQNPAGQSSPDALPALSTHHPLTPPQSFTSPPTSPPIHFSRAPQISTPYSTRPSLASTEATEADESHAIKQLFDAASNLGLDQSAINDLLARSASTSSRSTEWTMLTRNNSSTAPRPDMREIETADSNHSKNRKIQLSVPENPAESQPPPADSVRPRDGTDKSAVIRRTIIFPSESRSSTIDLSVLIRKHSSRRRRASATSVSSRSVHDRAPTPPPPRVATNRRFSTDNFSPPVPLLPQSIPQQADRLMIPSNQAAGPIENSTYDSLFEMYSGNKALSLPASENPRNAPVSEAGPAVEVVELANGETIWSIVNGLRDDDDDESGYTNRASFASEYSLREGNGDGVQVFFKDHGRKGSGGSSFLPRKKLGQGKSRPETKVFYSSSAQIGRLIENISQGMEAGSFNILPSHPLGHSTSSSLSETEMNWTVEERLEHMLHGLR
ncbi:hypothetical protein B0H10DRAFT_2427735 [Mycena sp. CBHHK59/15]|nr:hypothetical protein B0H10DRAFT_2427735 [Mycena sp. CBHHK59/15]